MLSPLTSALILLVTKETNPVRPLRPVANPHIALQPLSLTNSIPHSFHSDVVRCRASCQGFVTSSPPSPRRRLFLTTTARSASSASASPFSAHTQNLPPAVSASAAATALRRRLQFGLSAPPVGLPRAWFSLAYTDLITLWRLTLPYFKPRLCFSHSSSPRASPFLVPR